MLLYIQQPYDYSILIVAVYRFCSISQEILGPPPSRLALQNPSKLGYRVSESPPCDMSITVEIGLLSGRTAAVKASMDEAVETLRHRAQIALGVGKGRLVDSSGVVLDESAVIEDSGVRNGDSLALHVNRVQASATAVAFAVVLGDGSVRDLGCSQLWW